MESRLTVIDFSAFAHNVATIQQRVGAARIMAVVKANAYGHGLVQSGLFLQAQGVHALAVAFINEAIELRKNGVTIPILVLGSIIAEQLPLYFAHNIDIMAASIEKLNLINAYAQQYNAKARVHLKLDTGLGRIGMRVSRADEFFSHALALNTIELVGVASHFATSDEQDHSYMYYQLEQFIQACTFFEKNGLPMPIRHIANSGAIIQCPESYLDMVRPGIMLYGVYPSLWMRSLVSLKPVMSLTAKVVYFKVTQQNQSVSYGRTWHASQDTRVVTIPVGYGDGYPRALSNKGIVLINGKRYPIVGNVCMDQLMINVGNDDVFNGQEVVLIGTSGNDEISINDIAALYGGSPYELLVSMNNRIHRKYVNRQQEIVAFDKKENKLQPTIF